ncbi:MAG: prolyl oligopeptidase family serine peptidase [Saprospiraceae bacterium]|nr:prolyl oligopeptidase family serine peptidase [Saprospiraceae bacterium]
MITRLIFALLLLTNGLASQSSFLENNWVGRLELSGESHFMRIQFKDGQTSLQLPYWDGNTRYPLLQVEDKEGLPQFTIKRIVNHLEFQGTAWKEGKLEGKVRRNGLEGRFQLYRILPLASNDWQGYLGDYKTKDGLVFKVWDRFNTLRVHSPLSQEVSRMYPIAENQFWLATGESIRFKRREGEAFEAMQWDWQGQECEASRIVAFTEEKSIVDLPNGDTVGISLFTPPGSGRFPAVLIARGAANLDRSLNYTEAEIFASNGIATLVYDNYGTGETRGDLRTKDFEDKQKLVLQLYTYLQGHPKIQSNQIGLMGGSQGARIAAMAASKGIEPAFLILRAHPMETRKDQQLYAIGAFLRQRNVTEERIVQVLHLWEWYFDLASRQEIDQEYVDAVAKMRSAYPDLMFPAAPRNQAPPFAWPDDIYDATKDYLATIHCPVLSEHGVDDDRVPPNKSIHFLAEGLKQAGNDGLTVIRYPNANHSFTMPGFRIAPGLFMNEVNWMKETLKVP